MAEHEMPDLPPAPFGIYSIRVMLRFHPYYDPKPWGGNRLREVLGRDVGDEAIGEAWELCELGDRHSRVSHGGSEGKLLGDLWRAGVLGGAAEGGFPFLLKWLDAHDWMSVQVHPDDVYCASVGEGKPKTEAWCVVHAEPASTLLAGHYPGLDSATLRQAAQGGTLRKWMYELNPRAGDMLLIPAGMLHAVGPGFLILEVQQSSDSTFRIFDWGRVGPTGLPRELHLEQALAAVNYREASAPCSSPGAVTGPGFSVTKLNRGESVTAGPLRVMVAALGPCRLRHDRGEERLRRGDVVVAESDDGAVVVEDGPCLWLSA